MKTLFVHIDKRRSLALEYRPGFHYHNDLENGRIVLDGVTVPRVFGAPCKEFGIVNGLMYNGNGDLQYFVQRLTKEGKVWRGRSWFVHADEVPPQYKSTVTISEKEFAQ